MLTGGIRMSKWEYGKGMTPTEEELNSASPLMKMAMYVDGLDRRLPPFPGVDNGDGTLTFKRHNPFSDTKKPQDADPS